MKKRRINFVFDIYFLRQPTSGKEQFDAHSNEIYIIYSNFTWILTEDSSDKRKKSQSFVNSSRYNVAWKNAEKYFFHPVMKILMADIFLNQRSKF